MSIVAIFDTFVLLPEEAIPVYAVFSPTYLNDPSSARVLLEPKERRSVVAGSSVIKIIAVLLSVLSLSAATFSAAEIPVTDDSGQTCQNDAGSFALIGYQALLPPYEAGIYLSYDERETFHQASPTFRHTYRGPPTLF
jgi:hypothetical protein